MVVCDADDAGEEGASLRCSHFAGAAVEIRQVRLPYEIAKKHGKDLRDFFVEGHAFAELLVIANDSPVVSSAPSSASQAEKTVSTTAQNDTSEQSDEPLTNARQYDADGKTITEAIPMSEIIDELFGRTDGWPRCVNRLMFIDDPAHGIHVLQKTANLFGFLHTKIGKVEWYRNPGCVTREDLYAELQRTATNYKAVEAYPHFPPLSGHYYSHPAIVPGDGSSTDRPH